MTRGNELIGGLALGAGLMYLLDPDRGRRRRAVLRDQAVHWTSRLDDAAATTARDLGHRSAGVVAQAGARFRRDGADDVVVEERVRSALGRLVSHPGAIEVRAKDGLVSLSGPVLANEADALLLGVRKVRGVRAVEDLLEVHESAEDVPGLQGAGRRPGHRPELLQENWSPAIRLLTGLGGGALALAGGRARNPAARLLGVLGLGLLARAATNLPAKRMVGAGAGRRAVDVQKTLTVNAPPETVFAFWRDFENFPRFMSHLEEVRRTGDFTSHWVAAGPAGVPVAWDAEITSIVPEQLIAWRSVEGSVVASAGVVRFQGNEDGSTRIDVHLSYNPPGGAVGHAVASFFGADPRRAMDDDLVRLKSLLEEGKTSAHGETVERAELEPSPEPAGTAQ